MPTNFTLLLLLFLCIGQYQFGISQNGNPETMELSDIPIQESSILQLEAP